MARPKKITASEDFDNEVVAPEPEIESPELQEDREEKEEDRFVLDTFPVKVHGRNVEVYETEEELVEGVCVQIVLKTTDGCTYQGVRIEDGVLVQ